MKSWTNTQLATLRRLQGQFPYGVIARLIGKTESAVKAKAKVLGIQNPNRRLKPDVLESIRRDYGKVPSRELADRLGLTLESVYRAAIRLGLSRTVPRITEAEKGRIRELNALGWSDTEIGAELGHDRHEISRHRKRMGLPAHAGVSGADWSPHLRDRVRKKTAEQLERAGLKSLGEVRKQAYRDFAVRNGWPEDLRPRAVQILNLLASTGMPLTRRQIADGIGMPWKGSRKSLTSNDPEGSYLAHLAARGLVIQLGRLHHVAGQGKGRSAHLYCLGPAAMAILEERARQEEASCQPGL